MRRSTLALRIGLIVAATIAIGSTPARAAAVDWTGGTSFWDIATNWSSNPLLPGAADDVVINVGGVQTITHRSGTHAINSLSMTGDDILAVTGGSLTVNNSFTNAAGSSISAGTLALNGASGVASLALGGGALAGSGKVTITGASSWLAGSQSGTGITQFDNALSIGGAAAKLIFGGRSVNLNGTTTWGGNTGDNNNSLQFAGGTLNNAGTFNDQNAFASFIDHGNGTNAFNNLGTYNKQSNTVTTVEVFYNNTGTTNVNAGTLLMQGTSAATGVFNLASGATLEFRNGSHALNNATIAGPGTFVVSTDNVGADAIVTLNGGTLTSAFLMSGSTLNGTDQVFQGPATWAGGTINGSVTQTTTFGGTLTISGAGSKTLSGGRSMNAGNTIWSGNTGNNNNAISLGGSGTFNNSGSFTDANTFDSSIGSGTFNNSGTFNKQSNTTTSIGTVFNNTGTVDANAGTMLMGGGGTSTGLFNIANGAKLEFRNGNHTLNNVTTSGAGTLQISTENVGADAIVAINGGTHTTPFLLSGSTLTGADHTFQGPATWTGGTITGAATASTMFGSTLAISGPGSKTLSGGRSVSAGNTTWSGNTVDNNNAINISGASVFDNTGSFTDANTFDSAINVGNGGGIFNNNGVFNKQSNTTTSIGTRFNSTGTVNVNAGTMLMQGGGTSSELFNIANGAMLEFRNGNHTLNNVTTSGAGTLQISTENVGADAIVSVNGGTHTTAFVLSGSTLAGTDHTFQGPVTWTGGAISGAGATTFSNNVTISGPNLKTLVGGRTLNLNGTTTWNGNTGANNNAIRFWNGATINNNGTFNDANAFASFIEHNVGGPHNFNNLGTYNKLSNTVTTVDLGVVFNNAGSVNLNAGTMRFISGTQGPTGTVRVASGATYQHDAASTVGTLSTAGNLVLADRTLTVFSDYNNANFGVGDAFNRRANVSTSGTGNRLIAAGNANQGVSGAGVSNGTSTTPTLVIGNVHVGASTFAYNIDNTGSTGPALRGAIQTGVPGANITDARLSGSGVTAGNWGPLATGASLARDVVLTVSDAGAYTPVSGQVVSIVNNFENTRSQLLTISSAAGAAAYRLAAANTIGAVDFGALHVGDIVTRALTISNTAANDGFSEKLNASFGGTSDVRITTSGSFGLLGAGATDSTSLIVGLNTAAAGSVSGTATVLLQSDGTGTSGLGVTALPSQAVGVSGDIQTVGQVFRLAQPSQHTPEPVSFGNVRIGTATNLNLSLSNLAADDGFSEKLNASIGAASAGITAGGAFNLLAAQASDNTSLHVGIDAASAGARSGTAVITLVSDGTGTSGLGQTALPSQTVNVSGTVYRLASPLLNTASVDLVARVGAASPSGSVSITNTSPDSFTERMNASFGAAPAGFSTSGSVTGLVAGASSGALTVGLNTGTVGSFAAPVDVNFVSSGAGTTGAADVSVGSQAVNLSGRVYTPAVAELNTTVVDFGIVHRGDAVATRGVSVTNAAPISAPNDDLRGSIASAGLPFSATGVLTGLAAQATDTASFQVGLDTGSAGVFNASATATFISHNSEMSDLALGSTLVTLKGQVNNFAEASLGKTGGSGALSKVGNTYTLDFGTLALGGADLSATLGVFNSAIGPADLLRGSFDISGVGSGFLLDGFTSFAGIAAGFSQGGFGITFDSATLGVFEGIIVLQSSGSNASGFDAALVDTTLVLRGDVLAVAVPEPGTYLLMLGGLLLVLVRRERGRTAP